MSIGKVVSNVGTWENVNQKREEGEKETPLTNEVSIDPAGPLPEEAIALFLGYRSKAE